MSHAFTIRVPDCRAAYETLRARGAEFLTPPFDRGREVRCFFRDPDGHLFEISEYRGLDRPWEVDMAIATDSWKGGVSHGD